MNSPDSRLRGVLAPVLTPFDAGLGAEVDRFIAHCRWLVAQNASLAIFGTNSEAASLSVAERLALTDALLEAGIPPARLMPGTGASALTDAVELTRHASRAGAAGVGAGAAGGLGAGSAAKRCRAEEYGDGDCRRFEFRPEPAANAGAARTPRGGRSD